MPRTADTIRRLDATGDNRRALLAQALHHYADLLLLGSVQSTHPSQIDAVQLRKIFQRADSNQPIKLHPEPVEGRTATHDP